VCITTLFQSACDERMKPPLYHLAALARLHRTVATVWATGAMLSTKWPSHSELGIIRGAANVLTKTEFVIAEVNVLSRFKNSYAFAEFIAVMDGTGFRVADTLDIGRARTSEMKMMYLDLVFVRKVEGAC
jgi:hypothetical protein